MPLEQTTSKFDLTLSLGESAEGLSGALEYRSDLFERETIERMVGHLRRLLEGIVSAPGSRLSQLPMLTDEERQQLLVEWNDTAADYPRDQCIHQLFEEQVERTPDAVAVVFGDRQLTYARIERPRQSAGSLPGQLRRAARHAGGLVCWSDRSRWWSDCSASSRRAPPTCRWTRPIRNSAWR